MIIIDEYTLAASTVEDGNIYIIDLYKYKIIHMLQGHTKGSYGLVYNRVYNELISVSLDATIRIWDTVLYTQISVIYTNHSIYCIIPYNNGSFVIGNGNNEVHIYDRSANNYKTPVSILSGHSDVVEVVLVTPSHHIISGSYDTTVRIWK